MQDLFNNSGVKIIQFFSFPYRLISDKNGQASVPKEKEKDEDTFSLLNAQLDIRDSGKELAWWQRFKLFYDAPMITFRHNVVCFYQFIINLRQWRSKLLKSLTISSSSSSLFDLSFNIVHLTTDAIWQIQETNNVHNWNMPVIHWGKNEKDEEILEKARLMK